MAGRVAVSRVLTVPNVLSMLRIALVPVFLWLVVAGHDLPALIVLVIASGSDFLDGYLARRLRQVTRLGVLLDPAADRLYIFAAVLAFAWREILPWWLVLVIVARDVFIGVLGIVLARAGHGPLPVTLVGKIATFGLLLALPVLLLGQAFPVLQAVSAPSGWVLAIVGGVLYWCAGIGYAVRAAAMIANSPRGRRTASDTLDVEEVDGG